MSYAPPPDVEVFADEEMRIAVRSSGLPSYEAHGFSLKEEIRFELAAVTPQPLSAFQRRIHACQDLLSVATLSLCNVEEMRIVPAWPEGRPDVVGVLHTVPVFTPKEPAHHDFLFQYRDVKDRVREVFSSWLAKAHSLSAARALYTSAAYGDAFLEIRLLSYTQAVEAYHRRLYEGDNVYMDPGAYERDVLPGLQAAIPGGLQPSHRDALRNRLRFANEYSFRKRLGMMFDEHRAALTTVVPCADDWIDRIKDYRNGFTHHPVVDELHDMDTDEVLRCNEVLRLVLELSFLKAMGLTGEAIRDLAQGCHRYRAVRRRFFDAKP